MSEIETHKVVRTEVERMQPGIYGVRFHFDDGAQDFARAGPKEAAEFYAREQLGEHLAIGVHPLLLNAKKADKLRLRR